MECKLFCFVILKQLRKIVYIASCTYVHHIKVYENMQTDSIWKNLSLVLDCISHEKIEKLFLGRSNIKHLVQTTSLYHILCIAPTLEHPKSWVVVNLMSSSSSFNLPTDFDLPS